MARFTFKVSRGGAISQSALDAPALQALAVTAVDALEGDTEALAACALVTQAISGSCVVSVDPAVLTDKMALCNALRSLAESIFSDVRANGAAWPA